MYIRYDSHATLHCFDIVTHNDTATCSILQHVNSSTLCRLLRSISLRTIYSYFTLTGRKSIYTLYIYIYTGMYVCISVSFQYIYIDIYTDIRNWDNRWKLFRLTDRHRYLAAIIPLTLFLFFYNTSQAAVLSESNTEFSWSGSSC